MKKKFSLIELMVVMAIVGILVSLLIPMLGKSRSTARSVECLNEMRQYGAAYFMYFSDNDFKFSRSYYQGSYYYNNSIVKYRDTTLVNPPLHTQVYLDSVYTQNKDLYICPETTEEGSNSFTGDHGANMEIVRNDGSFTSDGINFKKIQPKRIINPNQFMLITDTNSGYLKIEQASRMQVRHNQNTKMNHLWLDGSVTTLTWTSFYNNAQWIQPNPSSQISFSGSFSFN